MGSHQIKRAKPAIEGIVLDLNVEEFLLVYALYRRHLTGSTLAKKTLQGELEAVFSELAPDVDGFEASANDLGSSVTNSEKVLEQANLKGVI